MRSASSFFSGASSSRSITSFLGEKRVMQAITGSNEKIVDTSVFSIKSLPLSLNSLI